MRKQILVTNDDGVRSEGILALADVLRPFGDVTIVAPLNEASAIGHALTLRRPLHIEKFVPVAEFLARYCERSGAAVTPDHLLFWRLFSEVKHSIISLTAARSFNDGRTRNIRHADRATTVTTYLSRFMEWLP